MKPSIALTILIILLAIAGCGKSHQFYDEAMQAVRTTEDILIEENLCKSSNDCSKKQMVYFESGSGVFITAYAISDQSVAEKIRTNICRQHNANLSIRYDITIYSSAKSAPEKKLLLQRNYQREITCQ